MIVGQGADKIEHVPLARRRGAVAAADAIVGVGISAGGGTQRSPAPAHAPVPRPVNPNAHPCCEAEETVLPDVVVVVVVVVIVVSACAQRNVRSRDEDREWGIASLLEEDIVGGPSRGRPDAPDCEREGGGAVGLRFRRSAV